MHVVRLGSRIKNGLVRHVMGKGIVVPGSGGAGVGRRKGEWRRKWNRSWTGEGMRLERSSFGDEEEGEEGRHVMSGWDAEAEEGPLLG